MERNLDLIRDILLAIEASPWDQLFASGLVIDGYESEAIRYNTFLARDAEFIDAAIVSSQSGDDLLIRRMTFAGHDYLDIVRVEDQWQRIKTMAKDSAITLTVESVKRIAAKLSDAAISAMTV